MNSSQGGLEEPDDLIQLDELLAIANRQWRVVFFGCVFGCFLGLAYLLTAVPLYTSSTKILVDKKQSETIDRLLSVSGAFGDDAEIASQVELIKSKRIALKVTDALQLHENANFSSNSSFVSIFLTGIQSMFDLESWFTDEEHVEPDVEGRKIQISDRLSKNVEVSQVRGTYVLSISYTSPNPVLARTIVRAYAEAYINDQLDSKYDATRRASEWLQLRIAELRDESFAADLKVQRYRRENNLLTTGGDQLISEQQLGEINSQLVRAQSEAAQAQAKYERIQSAIDSGRTDIVVDDVLVSSTINNLREKFLDSSKRESEITQKLGSEHIQAIRLRGEMRQYERLMFEELERIAESYKNASEVADIGLRNLETNLQRIMGVNADENETLVKLRELERESTAFRDLYENFLTRYQEATKQQSFPVTDSRVISAAETPERPSAPRKGLSLVLFAVFGGMVGCGFAAYREFRERFFRTEDTVRSLTGLEFFGFVKLIDDSELASNGNSLDRKSAYNLSRARYVEKNPLSAFAETLRAVKVGGDLSFPNKKTKTIGVVSCVPGEGKSTISSNLALLLAGQGEATLLIDGDLRNPGLTRAMWPNADKGIQDILLDNKSLQQVAVVEKDIPLAIVPNALGRRVVRGSELLTSTQMKNLLRHSSPEFANIVVDLPPVGPLVDAKAFSPQIDLFVFVIEWGKTSRGLVKTILANNPEIYEKCAGVILNKVDDNELAKYSAYGGAESCYGKYTSYYTEG